MVGWREGAVGPDGVAHDRVRSLSKIPMSDTRQSFYIGLYLHAARCTPDLCGIRRIQLAMSKENAVKGVGNVNKGFARAVYPWRA